MLLTRRDFLIKLGLTTVAVAAPKFIFDLGANLYKREADQLVFTPRFYLYESAQPYVFYYSNVEPCEPILADFPWTYVEGEPIYCDKNGIIPSDEIRFTSGSKIVLV